MTTPDAPPPEGLEARLATLEQEHAKMAGAVGLMADRIATLGRIVEKLGEAHQTQPARTAGPGAGRPEPTELAEWVTWLLDYYEIEGIPPCWPRHGNFVAEFEALYAGWLDAVAPDPGGLAATTWHDALGRALSRFHERRWGRSCLTEGHETRESQPAPDGDPGERMAARLQHPSNETGHEVSAPI